MCESNLDNAMSLLFVPLTVPLKLQNIILGTTTTFVHSFAALRGFKNIKVTLGGAEYFEANFKE